MSTTSPHLFWPEEIGPYEANLYELLANFEGDEISLLETVCNQLTNQPAYPNAEEGRLKYQAYLRVLSDLLRQEWQPEVRQGKLYLHPPDYMVEGDNQGIERHKAAIQRSLSWEREAQFHQSSVREFVRYMERDRTIGNKTVSIRSLIADGEKLANALQPFVGLEDEELKRVIVGVIRPRLELVTPNSRCQHTGLRLQDIWRYFRYKWATPYNPTPGRQMFYIIRDEAQPFHPVIGIAAIGSSLIQLTVRDDEIGWTPKAFKKRIMSEAFDDTQAQTIAHMFHKTIENGLDDITTDKLITKEELATPTEKTIEKLKFIEAKKRDERVKVLQQKRELEIQLNKPEKLIFPQNGKLTQDRVTPEDLGTLALDTLYNAKRARSLYRLLDARMALNSVKVPINTANGLRNFWDTKSGRKAIKALITENKKRKVGINMMDIIVCGAVPPYNTLLGGKLVAMLLAGPQVIADYESKYRNYASQIASQLKGEEVTREPKLVLLGTTSLYAISSSQYNRLAIPIDDTEQEYIRYIKYGLTKGYGSVHLSKETRSSLEELLQYIRRARLVNNQFGEGVNPKLRRISAGLSAIGVYAVSNFMRHRSRRIVYGIPLARSAYAFLRGETDDPDYLFDVSDPEIIEYEMKRIANLWMKRWLTNRVKTKYLDEISAFNKEEYLLSNELPLEIGIYTQQLRMNI